jgi:hypothetical protein
VKILPAGRALVSNRTDGKMDSEYSGAMLATEIPWMLHAGPALVLTAVLVCLILALNFD